MNDQLDDLLTPPPSPSDGTTLRQELLARTTGVLRRRRRLRQIAWVGALAACFIAGMVTMRWCTPLAPAVVAVNTQPDPKIETLPEPKADAPTPPETAVAVEYQALDATDRRERFDLYRKAARLYRGKGDFANWVRCEGNALDEAAKEDRAVSADDDAVLIALKLERQKKEKSDARNLD
jgi:hypothetical protein